MQAILDLRKSPSVRWRQVIKAQREQWRLASESLVSELNLFKRAAAKARALLYPATLSHEIHGVLAADSKLIPSVIQAAQVVYDESWAAHLRRPTCGCTSISTGRSFGRNLDWSFPENVADLVTRMTVVMPDGQEAEAEGIAGLLGWLAIRGDDFAFSLNQAPCLRPIDRTLDPALWWFREFSSRRRLPASSGSAMIGADVLVHGMVEDTRFILETHGFKMRAREMTGKVVQTNNYQLWNLKAGREWEADSAWRRDLAESAPTVVKGLAASAVEGLTIDTFMMRGAIPAACVP